MPKYYKNAFSVNGNKAPVADDATGTIVTYETGYTPEYEQDPLTIPAARFVERQPLNQILFDATENLKFIQENSAPEWIADDGTGVPYTYPTGAIVGYNGQTWICISSNNTAPPSIAGDEWWPWNGGIGLQVGTIIMYPTSDTVSLPLGIFDNIYIRALGQELSRITDNVLWEFVNTRQVVLAQATKDSDPETYAQLYGDGNGVDTFTVPDMSYNNKFLRVGGITGGGAQTINAGIQQGDAMRNITGATSAVHAAIVGTGPPNAGALRAVSGQYANATAVSQGNSVFNTTFDFAASRVVPTSFEFRPQAGAVYAAICRGQII